MNQKKIKQQKIDQAEIIYTASKGRDEELNLQLIISASMIVKDIPCPERVKYFKESISLAEEQKQLKTAFNLSAIALSKGEDKEFFLEICEKYQKSDDEAAHD